MTQSLVPIWILHGSLYGSLYGSYMDPYVDLMPMRLHEVSCWDTMDPTWIPIWILYGSLCASYAYEVPLGFMLGHYRSYMNPYMDLTWIPMWILCP